VDTAVLDACVLFRGGVRDFLLWIGPLEIRAEAPDEFCARLCHETPTDVIEGARLHPASLKRPSYNPGSYLDHLASLEFERTADLLRTYQATL
jgi:hypothetical protein